MVQRWRGLFLPRSLKVLPPAVKVRSSVTAAADGKGKIESPYPFDGSTDAHLVPPPGSGAEVTKYRPEHAAAAPFDVFAARGSPPLHRCCYLSNSPTTVCVRGNSSGASGHASAVATRLFDPQAPPRDANENRQRPVVRYGPGWSVWVRSKTQKGTPRRCGSP
jgi:hypothetical protein